MDRSDLLGAVRRAEEALRSAPPNQCAKWTKRLAALKFRLMQNRPDKT